MTNLNNILQVSGELKDISNLKVTRNISNMPNTSEKKENTQRNSIYLIKRVGDILSENKITELKINNSHSSGKNKKNLSHINNKKSKSNRNILKFIVDPGEIKTDNILNRNSDNKNSENKKIIFNPNESIDLNSLIKEYKKENEIILDKENFIDKKITENIISINLDYLKSKSEKKMESPMSETNTNFINLSDKENINNDNKENKCLNEEFNQNKNFTNISLDKITFSSSQTEVKEYSDLILYNIKNIKNVVELINELINFKDSYQIENIKKIFFGKQNIINDYNNKIMCDPNFFKNGFLFQNYLNNGIILDLINNFPKKGYTLLFSFKWEPLSENAINKKCDVFYFVEIKENYNNFNKNYFNGSSIKNNLEENRYSQDKKNIKIGFFILNRKIYIVDSNGSHDTNLEVIPGMSYVVLFSQNESSGFIKKKSKVKIFLIFL